MTRPCAPNNNLSLTPNRTRFGLESRGKHTTTISTYTWYMINRKRPRPFYREPERAVETSVFVRTGVWVPGHNCVRLSGSPSLYLLHRAWSEAPPRPPSAAASGLPLCGRSWRERSVLLSRARDWQSLSGEYIFKAPLYRRLRSDYYSIPVVDEVYVSRE